MAHGMIVGRLFMNFHWRIFHTGIQKRKAQLEQPFSLCLALWPFGSFEMTWLERARRPTKGEG